MAEEQFQKVANKKDLQEGSLFKIETEGKQIVLSMIEGKIYAIDDILIVRVLMKGDH
jgi:nitrite reductase/ring-hydroxylating ferredoxin subunit